MYSPQSSENALRRSLRNQVTLCAVLATMATGVIVMMDLPIGVPMPLLLFSAILLGGLVILPGWIAVGLRRDLSVGLITERCYVTSAMSYKTDTLTVRTPTRTPTRRIGVGNWTGVSGKQLEKHWVVLTYGRFSSIALHVELLEDEVSEVKGYHEAHI